MTSVRDPLGDYGESATEPTPHATVYLAFDIPPDTMPGGLAEIQRALADAARRITATGRPVHYLNGMYIPAQTRLLCVFAGESEQAVYDAAALVQLPFAEVRAITDRWERCPAASEDDEPDQ